MELSSLLHHFHLSSSLSPEMPLPSHPHDGHPCPPITEVLGRLQEKLIGAAERASDLETTALIGHIEELFKIADPHWLFAAYSTNHSGGLQNSRRWSDLEEAYGGLVGALARCAALPPCEPDSGSLPAGAYEGIPARALPVCSALSVLLGRLGDWERRTADRLAWTGGDREGGASSEAEESSGRRVTEGETGTGGETGPGGVTGTGGETGTRGQTGPSQSPGGPQASLVSLVYAVAPLCCVFAVTHFQVQAWTSPSSREAAGSLQGALLKAGGWRDPAHLLMGDAREEEEEQAGGRPEEERGGRRRSRGMLGGILDVLQPELNKDTWQRCEAVKLVFSWTLLQVTRPSLSPHLPRLLPPSLLLSDHYRPDNCLLGVRCVHHIVVNTPAAELRQFNRAEVLYQALYKHLYTTEAPLIQVVLSCLLDLLLVLEKPPSSLGPSSSLRRPCRHDDVLRLVLTHMEAEHKVALRRVYASALPQYIERMGIAVCRHLRRVERVVLGYLEVRDPPEERSRLAVLEVLEKTLRIAWPRFSRPMGSPPSLDSRVCVLLRCLLRLLLDASHSQLPDPVRLQLMNRTAQSLKLLDHCAPLQPLLQQVDSSCASPEVLRCLATVTTATMRKTP